MTGKSEAQKLLDIASKGEVVDEVTTFYVMASIAQSLIDINDTLSVGLINGDGVTAVDRLRDIVDELEGARFAIGGLS